MEISAISPVFSYDGQADRFCVIDQGWAALQAIGRRETTTDTPNLVAIYVTESPEREHNDDPATFGRIAALVRPDPMPHGHTVRNYPSGCLVLKRNQLVDRWPVGWPCTVAFISPYGGPFLRDVVWNALRISNYGDDFACQFLLGPIDLMKPAYAPLRIELMKEVRHQIALHPETQLLPF